MKCSVVPGKRIVVVSVLLTLDRVDQFVIASNLRCFSFIACCRAGLLGYLGSWGQPNGETAKAEVDTGRNGVFAEDSAPGLDMAPGSRGAGRTTRSISPSSGPVT